jgi:DNA-binding GntR family transcriptional regulator
MPTDVTPKIKIDRNSPVPLYHQVATQLEAAIRSGELSVGAWLDNEIDLASRLGVSRPTMRQAISQLVDAGFLVRKRGVGTRVVTDSIVRPAALTSLYDDLEEAGMKPNTEVRTVTQTQASGETAELFGAGIELKEIVRVRSVVSGPIALMHNWVPASFAQITAESLRRFGLYELLRSAGAEIASAIQMTGAREATAREAKLLDTHKGAACVTMKRRTYDSTGALLEVGDHLYRGDRYQFTSTLNAR